MAWRIDIEFALPPDASARNALMYRIWIFGEDLYVAFRGGRQARVDLADIDRTTDRICVTDIKNRQVGTVASRIRKILERHNLEDIATLAEVKEGAPDT